MRLMNRTKKKGNNKEKQNLQIRKQKIGIKKEKIGKKSKIKSYINNKTQLLKQIK